MSMFVYVYIHIHIYIYIYIYTYIHIRTYTPYSHCNRPGKHRKDHVLSARHPEESNSGTTKQRTITSSSMAKTYLTATLNPKPEP